jgi:hypothetical protein
LYVVNLLASPPSVITTTDRLFDALISISVDYIAVEIAIDTPFTPTLNYDADRHAFCGILSRRHFVATGHPLPVIEPTHALEWIGDGRPTQIGELKRHVEQELAGSEFRSAAGIRVEVASRALNLAIASADSPAELSAFMRTNSAAIDSALDEFAGSIAAHFDSNVPIRLTPREIDVLTLTASGRTRDESAALLGISPATSG